MTTMVPRARESGMFLRGSFTSPAVKVMLFHASAENSDPVCETQIARKPPRARRDRAGLNHEKQRPAVEKAPQRRERLAQVYVLAAGARHHRGELPIGQRADDGQRAREYPRRQQPSWRSDGAGHL